MEQKWLVPQMLLGQLETSESGHRPYSLHKNQLKMGHRPKFETENYTTLRR